MINNYCGNDEYVNVFIYDIYDYYDYVCHFIIVNEKNYFVNHLMFLSLSPNLLYLLILILNLYFVLLKFQNLIIKMN